MQGTLWAVPATVSAPFLKPCLEWQKNVNYPIPIIPVLDIQCGKVVGAVGGKRAEYRPIETPLVEGSDPVAVATALLDRTGGRDIYVADLDAIGGMKPAWGVYEAVRAIPAAIWLDAGVVDLSLAKRIALSSLVERVIVGLESLREPRELSAIVSSLGADNVVFSLDLRAGLPIATAEAWKNSPPLAIVDDVLAAGVQSLIVLDLARVGVKSGPPSLKLLRTIRCRAPRIQIIAGGGVRGLDDLQRLADVNCNAALVASWLHRKFQSNGKRNA